MEAAALPVGNTRVPGRQPRASSLGVHADAPHWLERLYSYKTQQKTFPDQFRDGLLHGIRYPPIIQLPGRKQIPIINRILLDQT